MNDLKHTIEQARAKGMDDQAVKNLLVIAGWDAAIVDAALIGIFVPKPPAAAAAASVEHQAAPAASNPQAAPQSMVAPAQPAAPQLSALEAALHHVLLWFFTLSMSITIGVVAATIFGTSQSVEAVTTFLATSVVTLLTFGFFYNRYVRRLKAEPGLTTNRVWTIITIVLHSVGAMSALITLIAVAINSSDGSFPILIASAMIATLDGLVVAVYVNTTFVHSASRLRLLLIRAFPILVLLLLVTFMVLSIMKVGPLRADDQTRENLVTAAQSVHRYASNSQALPDDKQGLDLPAGIDYGRKSNKSYELCANFKTKTHNASRGYNSNDSYPSTYDFANDKTGRQCFMIDSQPILDKQSNFNLSQ